MIGAYAIGATSIAGAAAGGSTGHGDANIVVTLPALTAVIAGGALDFASLAVSLPALTAVFVGTAPSTARVAATLPALTAAITMTTGPRRATRSWQGCPRPASGFASKGRVGTLRTDGGQPE